MALRTLVVAVSAGAAIAASCQNAEACAAAVVGDMGDEPSLIQTVKPTSGRSTNMWPVGKDKLGAAKDDEDPEACLVGLAEEFEQHPEYPGRVEIFGKVWVTASAGLSTSTKSQRVAWQLLDVDHRCDKGPGSSANSCSIHIEDGNQCKGESSTSAFDASARHVDPWRFVTYTSVKKGLPQGQLDKWLALAQTSDYTPVRTMLTMRAETGLSAKEVQGHTVVVYDFEGAPMACAPIAHALSRPAPQSMFPSLLQQAGPKPLSAAHFVPYPNSNPDLDVWGEVLIFELLGESIPLLGHYITWDLEGTDARCSKGRSATDPKSCSVRITKSTSCSDPNEEPLYKAEERRSNPWDYVSYTSVQGRHVVLARSTGVPVLTGHDSPDVMDQTVIIYDYDGKPAACAVVDFM